MEVIKINELISKTLIVLIIKLVRGYPKIRVPFYKDLVPYLIFQYDREAKIIRKQAHSQVHKRNIKYYRSWVLLCEDIIYSRSINKLIRIIDVASEEK